MIVASLELVAVNDDAEDPEADGEYDNNLKPKKRVATSRAARASGKARKNDSDNEKSGTECSNKDGIEAAEPIKTDTNSNGEQGLDKPSSSAGSKSDPITRRSSRNKGKPQVSKSEGR
uniref:TIDP2935 n=1 Tax=Arundo donax TaxID=35708 RepID=A0A0A9HE70_ARUDO